MSRSTTLQRSSSSRLSLAERASLPHSLALSKERQEDQLTPEFIFQFLLPYHPTLEEDAKKYGWIVCLPASLQEIEIDTNFLG